MAVSEFRKNCTKEFIEARTKKALVKFSGKRTKYISGKPVTFHTLTDEKFDDVVKSIVNSLEEDLSGGYWDKKSIV